MNPDLEITRSTSRPEESSVSQIISQYLLKNSQTFSELSNLRSEGWKTSKGDQFFQNRRAQSNNVSEKQAQILFNMTCQIGEEMDEETSVITLAAAGEGQAPRVLDIGMAPGGFSKTVLRTHPKARIRGITLPLEIGGIKMMLPGWQINPKVRIEFHDVTMLADEMGRPTTSIPTDHTDFAKFSSTRPFKHETFDLVFCGATVRYTQARAEYRESHERTRLVTSQLVVALQRLRQRGSLVLVMHKAEAINTAEIIRTFTKCSKVRLFKPEKKFAIKSSFYMIAMEVDTENKDLQSAILKWQKQWEDATFEANNAPPACSPASEDQVREMLTEFGPRLIELATPLWKTQADALRSSPFLK